MLGNGYYQWRTCDTCHCIAMMEMQVRVSALYVASGAMAY